MIGAKARKAEDRVGKLLSSGFWMEWRTARTAGIVVLFAVAVVSPGAFAQVGGSIPTKLKVGVVAAPPYVMKTADGRWEGLSADLWQAVASAIGVRYEIQEFGTFEQLVEAAAKGTLDVVMVLAATRERETLLDLTHPYYRSGLAIAVSAESVSRGWFGFLERIVGFSRYN